MWNAEKAEMYADQVGDDAPCGTCEGGKRHCGGCVCCAPDDPCTCVWDQYPPADVVGEGDPSAEPYIASVDPTCPLHGTQVIDDDA